MTGGFVAPGFERVRDAFEAGLADELGAGFAAMRDGVVHPTINVDEPDPQCDLDYIPDLGRRIDIEHAVSNCIAFGSKNSALLLRRI